MSIFIYILITLTVIIFLYYIFLKYSENKINLLEEEIKKLFLERTALIPSVFEISNLFLNKHEDIFHEILNLRKVEFSQSNNNLDLYLILKTKKLIHHEINFIFKICNKHPKLIKEAKFIYLRNLIIQRSDKIGKNIEKYKKDIYYLNKLIFYKNITIIGLLFPIYKKIKI
ncbi:MAG: hypothetical protein Q9M94_06100 [Candidatus Gracilibacteria bacterium]|nr:hypothetical protein [Candidatus Gracilibacteria bacterium]